MDASRRSEEHEVSAHLRAAHLAADAVSAEVFTRHAIDPVPRMEILTFAPAHCGSDLEHLHRGLHVVCTHDIGTVHHRHHRCRYAAMQTLIGWQTAQQCAD